jgi:hypothetical protein
MKFLVGYNGSVEAKAALSLAGDFAKIFNAEIFVMASLEGGAGEKIEDITQKNFWMNGVLNAKPTRWQEAYRPEKIWSGSLKIIRSTRSMSGLKRNLKPASYCSGLRRNLLS